MRTGIAALLISPDESVLCSLQHALESLEIQSDLVRNHEQARVALEGTNPPDLVFSDSSLADGTFAQVISTAGQAKKSIRVIVFSQVADHRLYTEVLRAGAADFLMPPFLPVNVSSVLGRFRQEMIGFNQNSARLSRNCLI